MKKIVLSFIAILLGITLSAGTISAPVATPAQEISYQDYCPAGYICIATNMKAKGYYGGATNNDLTGISVYKKDGNYIAYVPGHGHLSLYWSATEGHYGWHFRANSGFYIIENLGQNA